MATTAVFLTLWRDGAVGPETPVAEVLPESAAGRAGVTVADLLTHRAGLPAFLPLFAPVLRATPRLLEADCPPEVRAAGRAQVVAERPGGGPERAAGRTGGLQRHRVHGARRASRDGSEVARWTFSSSSAWRSRSGSGRAFVACRSGRTSAPSVAALAGARAGLDIAPTGQTRPREPAPGQEGLWEPFAARPSPAGEVDDDNAWAMDGVAGHAGLFGTAADVAAFGQAVLQECGGAGRVAPAGYWAAALRRDTATPGSTRALGFDTRLPGDPQDESSAGRLIGRSRRAPSATRATPERASGSTAGGTWSSRSARTAPPDPAGAGRAGSGSFVRASTTWRARRPPDARNDDGTGHLGHAGG